MKKRFVSLSLCVALLVSCATTSFINPLITYGITLGLQRAIPDAARRTMVANYADAVASALRTITGNPTSDQLTAQILRFIPANVLAQLPELKTIVIPFVVDEYKAAYDKYGGNIANVYAVLNPIAIDVENGVAPFITHTQSLRRGRKAA